MRRRQPLAIVFFALIAAGSANASGQAVPGGEDATARARELFREAVALADSGDWERAVDRFRTAIELRDAPSIRYNLASSLRHLGRLTEAIAELDRVDATADDAVRELAAALRAEMEPHIGRLHIDVYGGSDDTRVTVDGAPWAATGEPAPADPGIRVVRLFEGADPVETRRADVPDGGEARVVFRVRRPGPAEAVDPAAALVEAPGGGDDGVVWGLVVGAAVLAIGAAVLIGFFAAEPSNPMGTMGDFTPPFLRVD